MYSHQSKAFSAVGALEKQQPLFSFENLFSAHYSTARESVTVACDVSSSIDFYLIDKKYPVVNPISITQDKAFG